MLGAILLGLVTIFTVIWTINWILHARMSRGHFWAVVEIVFMWALVVYFFLHPSVSRFHLIWAAPVSFFLGFLVSGVFLRARQDRNNA